MSYRDSMNDRIESDRRWQDDIMGKKIGRDHPPLTDYSALPDERDDRIARLTAEVERLRGALDKIGRWQVSLEACVQFARRALADADADTGEGRDEGWIACSERMPDEDGNHNSRRVLACVWYEDNPQPQTWLCWTHRGEWRHDDGRELLRRGLRVSHWRPLPAPPRTDDEKEGR